MQVNNNKSLRILFISNGIFVFADRLLGPLYAIFAEKFDANVLSIGFSWFVFMGSATVFTFIVLKYGDKIVEKEYLLIGGFMLRVLAWFLYIFTNSLTMFILIQIILGLGDAIGSPAFDSIFAKHLNKGNEVHDYSSWKLVQNMSLAIASLLGGIIVYYISFEALFVAMALLGCISSLIVYFQPRDLL